MRVIYSCAPFFLYATFSKGYSMQHRLQKATVCSIDYYAAPCALAFKTRNEEDAASALHMSSAEITFNDIQQTPTLAVVSQRLNSLEFLSLAS